MLISPYIKPGTSTSTYYNHYSWLQTMEDLFGITKGGADGHGHLGYAGQTGLRPFGTDVFNNPSGVASESKLTSSLEVGLPVAGLAIAGGDLLVLRRRRRHSVAGAPAKTNKSR